MAEERELALRRLQRICDSEFISVLDFWNNPLRIFAAHELAAIIDPAMTTKMTVQVRIYELILFFTIFLSFLVEFGLLRGHSTTTWTEFCHFLIPPPMRGEFLYPKRRQKQTFLTPPPSSCPRSY